MISDDLGRRLHDQATRGEQLSPADQVQLTAWYAEQDRREAGALGVAKIANDTALLQAQIDSTTEQLSVISRRIQMTAAQNAALRREINALHQRLAAQAMLQPA